MQDLTPDSRLRVAATLQRILHGAVDSFSAADAEALWRELAALRPPPRLGGIAVGRWRLRRYRRWLHFVIEVESAAPCAGERRWPVLLRYTLFGRSLDMLRLRGRTLDLPVWPGLSYGLVLGAFRPWKRATA